MSAGKGNRVDNAELLVARVLSQRSETANEFS